jgi:hypothetical protein
MISTTYRDGYGLAVELHHGTPHVCLDGVTRTWIGVTITDDEHGTDPSVLHVEVLPADLADLAAMLAEVAEAHGGTR